VEEEYTWSSGGLIRLFKVKMCAGFAQNLLFTKGFLKWIFFIPPTLKNRSKKGWFSQVFSPINFRFADPKGVYFEAYFRVKISK